MTSAPQIPHGYTRVFGQAQKGDGIWDGTRFRKVRKQYPSTEPREIILIRKLTEQQQQVPGVAAREEV